MDYCKYTGICCWAKHRSRFRQVAKSLFGPRFHHSHKKRKDSLETPAVMLIFSLALEISRVSVQRIHLNSENGSFCMELPSENYFEAVLATFCCYDYGAKAPEAVQKIATDQKEYRKCSSCVIICWIAKIYLSINNSEKWLVTKIPPT